jgi:hypothetical protein
MCAICHAHLNFLDLIILIISRGHVSKVSVQVRGSLWHYGEELLAPRPTPKLEDHLLSALRYSLFNMFAATLHIWRPSPPSATWGRAMPWWQRAHLTRFEMVFRTWSFDPRPTCKMWLYIYSIREEDSCIRRTFVIRTLHQIILQCSNPEEIDGLEM